MDSARGGLNREPDRQGERCCAVHTDLNAEVAEGRGDEPSGPSSCRPGVPPDMTTQK
jgi:hypothetical protein